MVVLCAGAIGKTKCTAMKQKERTTLMRYFAFASQRLISDSLISITNQHHNTQVDTSPQVSGRHSTLPFNTAAAEILRAAAEEGQDMQIVLPDPSIQHPYLILPLEVATRIMRRHNQSQGQ